MSKDLNRVSLMLKEHYWRRPNAVGPEAQKIYDQNRSMQSLFRVLSLLFTGDDAGFYNFGDK